MNQTNLHKNAFGQPLGEPLPHWVAPAPVQAAALTRQLNGKHCSLEKLNHGHLPELQAAFKDAPETHWTYLPYGPMQNRQDFDSWLDLLCSNSDAQVPYGIRLATGELSGVAAYLRTNPEAGSIEIGHLSFAPAMQQSRASTEALVMLIEAVFLLGYRRCEWKCNALNAPSIKAAKRLGFSYEGTFRNAQVVKGANRDTAWFSIIEQEWSALKSCYERWLADDNFDADGQQIEALSKLTSQAKAELQGSDAFCPAEPTG